MRNEKPYDLAVFIGRFQPLHKGHVNIIQRASNLADNVLILVGSANGPRTIKNPWTYEERKEFIQSTCPYPIHMFIEPLNDYVYNDNKWITEVGSKVQKIVTERKLGNRIAVVGYDKDHSSYYLNYFPQWKFEEMPAYPRSGAFIDSTKIREFMFTGKTAYIDGVIPEPYFGEEEPIHKFMDSDIFKDLKKEWDFVQDYKQSWASAPYAPTFVTVDAIVEQSGHVLLVERGSFPGKGLWATPGGFIDPNEKLIDGVVRELREETGLKVPEKVLRGSIVEQGVFDQPDRSTRGRTITHAFLFKLDDSADLPRVRGGDDAAKAKWIPLSEFENMQSIMYEDHWHIVKNMINRR